MAMASRRRRGRQSQILAGEGRMLTTTAETTGGKETLGA